MDKSINLVLKEDFFDSDSEIIDGYEKLPSSVKELISRNIVDQLNEIVGMAESCQSPIEQLLGIALEKHINKILPYYTHDFFITTQETLEYKDNKYRVDFLVVVRYKQKHYGFVVECDGHDFHEKTKEQAKRDKKRDRDLMQLGHPVIRFTGSEIFESPQSCARDIVDIITNHLEKG